MTRHGTNGGYRAGCRDQCCRDAHAAYRRSVWRKRYARRTDRLYIDATGTIRRVRALMALGWRLTDIEHALGRPATTSGGTWVHNLIRGPMTEGRKVHIDNARAIAAVYDQLCMTPGPSRKTAKLAVTRGWVAPLGWDDIDTDPEPARADDTSDYDEAVVLRALAGEWGLAVEHADRAEVARRWVASGRTAYALWQITRWKVERYFTVKETA